MAAIAVTRFGLGARPGELAAAKADPQGFLKAQIRATGADQPAGPLPGSAERLNEFRGYQQMRRAQETDPEAAQRQIGQMVRQQAVGAGEEFMARVRLAVSTEAAFRERWTLFWANHFTVSAVKLASANQAGPFEREAIRPHVFGRFEDLLLAASGHPGMMIYLDQVQSVGPNSPMLARARGRVREAGPRGLNENLAREILELHTVGIGAGYTQEDVTEFARALTGFSVGGPNEAPERQGRPVFRQIAHEPGRRQVMGKAYADTGEKQAPAILRDLAAHPATARHLASKIARHYVADDPPPALVARLEQSFLASGGRLDKLAQTLIEAPEAWAPQAAKFKTPYDYVVSSWRALGAEPRNPMQITNALNQLGQRPFAAPSPKGWPDEAAAWAAPDAVLKRLAFAEDFAAARADRTEPLQLAQASLGARLSKPVMASILGAESRQEALTILLMSPEFQRR